MIVNHVQFAAHKVGVSVAKSKKVDVSYDGKGKYLPEWVRDYATGKGKSGSFQPCNRCQTPSTCEKAGRCLAEDFG